MTKPTRGAINELFALLKPFRLIVSASIVLGMIGGLSVTVLLATINNALHSDDGLTRTVVMIFAALRPGAADHNSVGHRHQLRRASTSSPNCVKSWGKRFCRRRSTRSSAIAATG